MRVLPAGKVLFRLVGTAALAYVAIVEEQLGFMLLESAWAASLAVLVRLLRPPLAEAGVAEPVLIGPMRKRATSQSPFPAAARLGRRLPRTR